MTKYYIDSGYINSGAVIPSDQNIQSQDGVVKMQIIEGRVEDIKVIVDGRLNPNYVRSRLAIATQPPLNRDRLLEALQLLQLDPLIQNISAELSAGSRPELSLLAVKGQFGVFLWRSHGEYPGSEQQFLSYYIFTLSLFCHSPKTFVISKFWSLYREKDCSIFF